jgi:hypothetical protein
MAAEQLAERHLPQRGFHWQVIEEETQVCAVRLREMREAAILRHHDRRETTWILAMQIIEMTQQS